VKLPFHVALLVGKLSVNCELVATSSFKDWPVKKPPQVKSNPEAYPGKYL
jgi:hypothetical protein